jgi:hypothetical protein
MIKEDNKNVVLTGYMLGGFIAVNSIHARFEKNLKTKAVVFDCPGILQI